MTSPDTIDWVSYIAEGDYFSPIFDQPKLPPNSFLVIFYHFYDIVRLTFSFLEPGGELAIAR